MTERRSPGAKAYDVVSRLPHGSNTTNRTSGWGRLKASHRVQDLRRFGHEAYVVEPGEVAPWDHPKT